jgi:methyl-accepting chemotaxis protein
MISLIDDVTDRTNVLAINAAVESARAGHGGDRFSIIAKEIRNLASSTIANTKNIYKSLSHTIEMMKESQKISNQSYDAFEMIVKSVKGVESLFAKILEDMTSLEDNSNQIVYSISQLSDIAKKVRDSVLEIESSSVNIKELMSEIV